MGNVVFHSSATFLTELNYNVSVMVKIRATARHRMGLERNCANIMQNNIKSNIA